MSKYNQWLFEAPLLSQPSRRGASNYQWRKGVTLRQSNSALLSVCPPDGQTLQRVVYGWSQYKRQVKELPAGQQVVLTEIGNTIIRSFDRGCQPIRIVRIEGHADYDTPRNPKREQQMSDERAQTVMNWLRAYVGNSIATQIQWNARGFGATLLKKPPTTPDNRGQNRRVEVSMAVQSKPKPQPPPPQPKPPIPPPKGKVCDDEGRRFLTAGVWNGSTTLQVTGGQSMRFTINNLNVLPTTITIRDHTGRSQSRLIAPLGTIDLTYSIFGAEPMGWRFVIDTNSDAFLVSWQLCSTWVPGDPPNR